MELINQLSWSAYFEQRGNQQRRGLGELLLEGGGCAAGVGLGERWRRECAPRQHGWHGRAGGEMRECLQEGNLYDLHCCSASGSGLPPILPTHQKHFPKAGGEGGEQATCSVSGEAVWWLARELGKALSSSWLQLLGRLPPWKKKKQHLQLVGQDDSIQLDKWALQCLYSALQTASGKKKCKEEVQVPGMESLSCAQCSWLQGERKSWTVHLCNSWISVYVVSCSTAGLLWKGCQGLLLLLAKKRLNQQPNPQPCNCLILLSFWY